MKHLFSFFLLAAACLLFSQCGKNEKSEEPAFDGHISSFTGGSISRTGEVRVIFSNDLPQETLDKVKPETLFTLTPKVEGRCTFSDARTLTFTPKGEFKRDTKYEACLHTEKLFDDGKPFTFSFSTRPFAINASLKHMEESDNDEYLLTFNVNTADGEKNADVESHIKCSLPCTTSWTHAADGLSHQLFVTIKPTTDVTLDVQSVSDASLNYTGTTLTSVDLPAHTTFTLMSAKCKADDRHYIELTFNKDIDPKQDVKGLIYLEGRPTQVQVEDNKARVYGSLRDGETVTVMIEKNLRSRNGATIGEVISREVVMEGINPEVSFVGNGTIIPQGDQILIPFRSIHMRGVRVMVYKIFGNTVSTLLQHGDLSDYNNFFYAARPIAATTFYMDQSGADLSEWHTYAIDLTKQVQLEPGAMYRVELSLDARLASWPSDSLPTATAEEIARDDAKLLERMNSRFDTESYYYTGCGYYQDNWWTPNYYQKHRNPAFPQYYHDRTVAKNVLATNIGLTAIKGTDNLLHVTAINLPDAQPMNGIEVEAYSLQQQLVGSARTNADGRADISYDGRIGQPYYVTARKGNDVSYLKVDNYTALSTSTFDVSGSHIERGLKGFIYGERGVWRPGDTLHIGFMLNDRQKTLPQEHPVTLRLFNPLGQMVNTFTRTSGTMGIYTFNIPTEEDAPTGIWSAKVEVGGVNFEKNLRIEAIKPNRLKINLTLPEGTLDKGSNQCDLHAEWLNGNVAGGLKYDINATIVATQTSWKTAKDYVFDDASKSFETVEQELLKGSVNGEGNAKLSLKFDTGKKAAPGLLRCNLVTHLYEPSGEFSTDVTQALISTYPRYVGIKAPAQTKYEHLDTDKDHTYHLLCVDKDGNAIPNASIAINVYKIEWYWWWRSTRDDLAEYTSSRHLNAVKTLLKKTDNEGKASFKLNMTQGDWGSYLIVAEDTDGHHSASVTSYFDWPWISSRGDGEGGSEATALAITTDKKEYAPGERMHLSIPSEEGSRAIVSICNGSHVLYLNTFPCQKGQTEILLDVTDEMTPSIFVAVSLVQPYSQTVNDMPIRMYGIVPVTVTSPRSRLSPVITSADEVRPETNYQVTVAEKEGRPMAYTLAIVDEGLLDLTHFKTPNAWSLFNAKEALGVRFWDLYRHVNGAYGGRIEQMFSIGGDEALNNGPKAFVNRFTPMVHFAGPFSLKKGEKRNHNVYVPNYNGRVRVMVVAGDGEAYGNAEKSVIVRRPLMLIGTMPRQIGVGDEMTVSATVFATQKLGKVKVTIETADGLSIVGDKSQQVEFDEAGDKTVLFRIKAGEYGGVSTVSIKASSSNDKAEYTTNIDMRTVSQTLYQTIRHKVEPGKELDHTYSLPGNSDQKVSIEVSSIQPLNIVNRLSQLLAYPHGCVEQTTSKGFPQLYLSEFAELSDVQAIQAEENVKACIRRLSSFQTADGGMSYWPGTTVSSKWPSAYVLHFLTEASARGYFVPEDMTRRLKKYLATQANAWNSINLDEEEAYVLYVLANAQAAELGAMNRMREYASKLSVKANYFLASAYALCGRQEIAKELIKTSSHHISFYWMSEDAALLVAQLLVSDDKAVETAEKLRKVLVSDTWLSTSNCSFSLFAMSKFYQGLQEAVGLDFKASLNGKSIGDVKSKKFFWSTEEAVDKKETKLTLKNRDDKADAYVTVNASGVATQTQVDAIKNGLELSLRYFESDGITSLNPAWLPLNTTFKAKLTVRNTAGKNLENVAITHILPAGWEVLSATPSGTIHYQDKRDDRILSYIDLLRTNETVTVDLTLSATYAGKYYLPAVQAEAMYEATIQGCTASGECEVK